MTIGVALFLVFSRIALQFIPPPGGGGPGRIFVWVYYRNSLTLLDTKFVSWSKFLISGASLL